VSLPFRGRLFIALMLGDFAGLPLLKNVPFARDIMVQEVGFAMLRDLGVTLIAADSPSSFLDDGRTSKLVASLKDLAQRLV
jgi:hypothetical protein